MKPAELFKVELKEDIPSITSQMVRDAIKEVHTCTVGLKTTVVRAVLWNGFVVVATSSCVGPETYDEKIGKDICMEQIRHQVWYLLGFLLQTAKPSEA